MLLLITLNENVAGLHVGIRLLLAQKMADAWNWERNRIASSQAAGVEVRRRVYGLEPTYFVVVQSGVCL